MPPLISLFLRLRDQQLGGDAWLFPERPDLDDLEATHSYAVAAYFNGDETTSLVVVASTRPSYDLSSA
jgi:hypothetical protein